MLSKDKLFDINEFVFENGHNKLWEVSDKLINILSDLASDDARKSLMNKFFVKNGYKNVCDLEKSIYNMVQDVLNCCEAETAQVIQA